MTTNLEELERLHAAHLTGLEASTWDAEDGECVGAIVRVFDTENFGEAEDAGNGTAYEYAEAAGADTAAAAVKCLNALPGLIAELRTLRKVARVACRLTDMLDASSVGVRESMHGPFRELGAALDAVPK